MWNVPPPALSCKSFPVSKIIDRIGLEVREGMGSIFKNNQETGHKLNTNILTDISPANYNVRFPEIEKYQCV